MNAEEYKVKIKELRKERDFHQQEYQRLMKEMDELTIDSKYMDIHIGKFIKFDRRSRGGYLEFFHVDHWEKRPRGIDLYGSGFNVCEWSIHIDNSTQIFLEDTDMNSIVEITEEDFYKAFDTYVAGIRKTLADYNKYKKLDDGFKFKNSLVNAMIEKANKNSLAEQVLESLKTE